MLAVNIIENLVVGKIYGSIFDLIQCTHFLAQDEEILDLSKNG